MSRAALDRILADRVQTDPSYKTQLGKVGRALLSDARALDDDALQAKLEDHCGPIDRQSFSALTRDHDSAESVAKAIIAQRDEPLTVVDEDWLWFALTVIWERWQPDRPSLEMLEDWMQDGYQFAMSGQLPAACDLWRQAWSVVTSFCEKHRIDSIDALDQRLAGRQSVFNWLQDFELELSNAGLQTASYLHERIELCRDVLARFRDLDSLTRTNFRCGIAGSLAGIGDTTAADTEFDALTRADPTDDSLWSRWSNALAQQDAAKAMDILQRGLAVPGLSDRQNLLERVVEFSDDAGCTELVEQARHELAARPAEPASAPASARAGKVGRNDPCPCGSDKKYKKCCLGRATE